MKFKKMIYGLIASTIIMGNAFPVLANESMAVDCAFDKCLENDADYAVSKEYNEYIDFITNGAVSYGHIEFVDTFQESITPRFSAPCCGRTYTYYGIKVAIDTGRIRYMYKCRSCGSIVYSDWYYGETWVV